MSIKKRTTGAVTTTTSVGLGAAYARVHRVDVVASADTSVAVTITDADSVVVYTLASGDHTTAKRQYVEPEEANVVDTAGEAAAANSQGFGGVIAKSPVSVAISGVGSGTATVDLYVEV